jgi:hypothetical protein
MAHKDLVKNHIPENKISLDNYDKGFKAVYKAQKEGHAAFGKLKKQVDDCRAKESCKEMQRVLEEIRASIEKIQQAQDEAIVSRLDETVLGKLAESRAFTYEPMNKLQKQVCADEKRRDKLVKAGPSADPEKLREAKKVYKSSLREFLNKMEDYETKRLEEMKNILMEFCNSQLYYHCRAIESWTAALKVCGNIDSTKWIASIKKAVKEEKEMKNVDSDSDDDM